MNFINLQLIITKCKIFFQGITEITKKHNQKFLSNKRLMLMIILTLITSCNKFMYINKNDKNNNTSTVNSKWNDDDK